MRMHRVIENRRIAPNTYLLRVEEPEIVKRIMPGQFVIVMPEHRSERVPLSVGDWDESSITIVYLVVGTSTRKLCEVKEGECLPAVVGPLGIPTEIENFGTVLCAGGCYGVSAIYPIARALKAKGNYIIAAIEQRSKVLHYWEERIRGVADEVFVVSSDGTYGIKGHNDLVIKSLVENGRKIDKVIAIGCTWMMKVCSEATREAGIKTVVSLNPIMIDGTGMCGVCRVIVGGKTKFACVDGPEFDGHEVDWDVLLARKHMYFHEEIESLHRYECIKYG
jgi:ferredoxin--NADP+ reductase